MLISYREGRTETRLVCRDHDDSVKAKVRQNVGPKHTDPPATQLPAAVACGECGRILDEPQSLPVEQRQPCLDCGSTKRQIRVTIEERLELHDSLAVTGTRAGQPNRKWFQRSASGDSFTRDHDAWGGRILEMNRETAWEGKTPSEKSSRTLVDVMQASENRPRLDFAADRARARGGSFRAQCAQMSLVDDVCPLLAIVLVKARQL